jgi:thiamine biosynthesis lipoprotein
MRVNVQRHSLRAMGSTADILAVEAPRGAVRWAIARLRALERCWSRFDPASELCALNRRAGLGPTAAGADLRLAVARAVRLWHATDGLFDPSVLDALVAAGYDRSFRDLPARRAVAAPSLPVPSPHGVLVDDDEGTITLPAGVHLDLGGVGKGLAADLVAGGLVALGAHGACVSVGGDVAVAGSPPVGRAWTIPVEDPSSPGQARWQVPLTSGAIAQSTTLLRFWEVGDRTAHHLIDPRAAAPADSGIVATVVVADEAWWAEGVAKAALIAGPVAGPTLIERLAPAGWLLRADGTAQIAGDIAVRSAA